MIRKCPMPIHARPLLVPVHVLDSTTDAPRNQNFLKKAEAKGIDSQLNKPKRLWPSVLTCLRTWSFKRSLNASGIVKLFKDRWRSLSLTNKREDRCLAQFVSLPGYLRTGMNAWKQKWGHCVFTSSNLWYPVQTKQRISGIMSELPICYPVPLRFSCAI